MSDAMYWFYECKVCSHCHLLEKVGVKQDGTFSPFDGVRPCLNRAGESAHYQSNELKAMTEAQWREAEQKLVTK
jgi:hypothetical protein